VSGGALVNIPTPYLDIDGSEIEAEEICIRFIDLVENLINKARTTFSPAASTP
jgi:hypothetical protein